MYKSRAETIQDLLGTVPRFRFDQINTALFDVSVQSWAQVTTLPIAMREALEGAVPWLSISLVQMFESERNDTFKAVLKTADDKNMESVLMANKKGQWTICVSSQIGCAMRCTFCATGTMGLKRSMHSDEIVDQYRFWQAFLLTKPDLPQRISNIVFMGMGEPLANYENVKSAIHTWLTYTDLGPTKIMVSTVGVLSQMEKLLTDPEWPPVRITISLHSANQGRREEIVPTTIPDFIEKLADWSHRYRDILGNRRHHLTFEYTLISHVNDEPELARELATYVKKTAVTKVNVIPYNPVFGKTFTRTERDRIDIFKQILRDHDVNVTERKTMGDDINAACGQLALSSS
jgi:23S rRNA (adenine2503-C2)-methyltransferase